MNNEVLYITTATSVGNLCVNLTFNDGTSQVVDVGAFIRKHPHPQYNKYLDQKKFNKFVIEDGNVVWGRSWDMVFPVEELHAGVIR